MQQSISWVLNVAGICNSSNELLFSAEFCCRNISGSFGMSPCYLASAKWLQLVEEHELAVASSSWFPSWSLSESDRWKGSIIWLTAAWAIDKIGRRCSEIVSSAMFRSAHAASEGGRSRFQLRRVHARLRSPFKKKKTNSIRNENSVLLLYIRWCSVSGVEGLEIGIWNHC